MTVLHEVIALCTITAKLDSKLWYRRILRPLAIAVCGLCMLSALFIPPKFGTLINLCSHLLDISYPGRRRCNGCSYDGKFTGQQPF